MPTRSASGERSLSRGRTRTRSRSPASPMRSRSPRRSISPRSASRSRSYSRSQSPVDDRQPRRNGNRWNNRRGNSSSSRSRSAERPPRSQGGNRSPSKSPQQTKSSKIVVEKLTKNVGENHLREIFGVYGRIQDLDMPMNRQFMTNRGTAYISYDLSSSAVDAITHMHEAQLDGTVINVSIVLPRRQLARSPPISSRRQVSRQNYTNQAPSRYPGYSYRSPPPRRRSPPPPRAYGNRMGVQGRNENWYRPRSYSRSKSPRRSRSRSVSSRSRSVTPPQRSARGGYGRRSTRQHDGGRMRRSPSYSSYSSYSNKSRSQSRSRSWGRVRR